MLRKVSALKLASGLALTSMASTQSLAAVATTRVDPLVAVSALGTPESYAAVRSLLASQAATSATTAKAPCPEGSVPAPPKADQPPGTVNCVVPRASVPPAAPPTAAMIPLAAVLAGGAGLFASKGKGHGNLQPVSPP
jgi:hypothetical protein